ncbi:hypothetical protein [Caulobacter segnis]
MSDFDLYPLQSDAVAGAYALPETENGYGFGVDGEVRVRVHYSRKTDKFSVYRNHILHETYRREIDAHSEEMNESGWANDPGYFEAA